MTDLRVIRWGSYRDGRSQSDDNLAPAGGFFNTAGGGQRWNDYPAIYSPEFRPHLEAIREEIFSRSQWECGYWNQNESPAGMPIQSNGVFFQRSLRARDDLMAAVWSKEHGRDYRNVEFAREVPSGVPARR